MIATLRQLGYTTTSSSRGGVVCRGHKTQTAFLGAVWSNSQLVREVTLTGYVIKLLKWAVSLISPIASSLPQLTDRRKLEKGLCKQAVY